MWTHVFSAVRVKRWLHKCHHTRHIYMYFAPFLQDIPYWKKALEPVYRFTLGGLAGGEGIHAVSMATELYELK